MIGSTSESKFALRPKLPITSRRMTGSPSVVDPSIRSSLMNSRRSLCYTIDFMSMFLLPEVRSRRTLRYTRGQQSRERTVESPYTTCQDTAKVVLTRENDITDLQRPGFDSRHR